MRRRRVHMRDIMLSLAVGIAVGVIFRALKLPVPAPPAIEGVMGIVGIFLGYKVAQHLL